MKKTLALFVAALLVVTALCASVTVSAETTNVALGKSYTVSQQYRQSRETWSWADDAEIAYPDDGKKLTDGKLAEEDTGYDDPAWIGFHGGAPEYKGTETTPGLGYSYMRVDLGAVYALTELKLYVGTIKLTAGITVPTSVEFYVSEDGKTYTGLGELTPVDTEESVTAEVSQKTDVSARFVEIRIKREANWMFVSEFEAYADASTGNTGNTGNTGSDDENKGDKSDETSSTPSESAPAESTPSEATSSGSDKVPTGDTGILLFAVLGVVAVAGMCIAVRQRRSEF